MQGVPKPLALTPAPFQISTRLLSAECQINPVSVFLNPKSKLSVDLGTKSRWLRAWKGTQNEAVKLKQVTDILIFIREHTHRGVGP